MAIVVLKIAVNGTPRKPNRLSSAHQNALFSTGSQLLRAVPAMK